MGGTEDEGGGRGGIGEKWRDRRGRGIGEGVLGRQVLGYRERGYPGAALDGSD